ncbi:hypothetical protein EG68_12489 [Paragonimus skrjabini miyazakii]|uniref:Uncharacterized protein n=1 Tax=Paragonimus skrjabini miyazakii TaxID=59628 RepID=A0A8S9YCN7_9TREM|nr:hypothetical protein EG68_12489 [Paragonimus skrjabini miyazakii]
MLLTPPKKDFQKVVHSKVRIREELHSMRLGLNALRFTLAQRQAKLSDDFSIRFPMNSAEDVKILNKQLEDRRLHLKLVTRVNGNDRMFKRIMFGKSAGQHWVIADNNGRAGDQHKLEGRKQQGLLCTHRLVAVHCW